MTAAPLAPVIALLLVTGAAPADADETDNFTCRSRLTIDAEGILNEAIATQIQAAVDRANGEGPSCGTGCLVRHLRRLVGGSAPARGTWIPHSRFALWVARQSGVERCHLGFGASIYGARPYNQPWLFPFTHRIIFLADSILLSGRVVGVDKLDHFIREGRAHHDEVARGRRLEDVLKQEQGRSDRPLALSELGLKGLALTGVASYADLAAGYSGLRFWQDLLAFGGPRSFVAYEANTARFLVIRSFAFGDYVTDAWDETINRSRLHPVLARSVEQALRVRGIGPIDCRQLARLPDATLYVNPDCLR